MRLKNYNTDYLGKFPRIFDGIIFSRDTGRPRVSDNPLPISVPPRVVRGGYGDP